MRPRPLQAICCSDLLQAYKGTSVHIATMANSILDPQPLLSTGILMH